MGSQGGQGFECLAVRAWQWEAGRQRAPGARAGRSPPLPLLQGRPSAPTGSQQGCPCPRAHQLPSSSVTLPQVPVRVETFSRQGLHKPQCPKRRPGYRSAPWRPAKRAEGGGEAGLRAEGGERRRRQRLLQRHDPGLPAPQERSSPGRDWPLRGTEPPASLKSRLLKKAGLLFRENGISVLGSISFQEVISKNH